MTFGSSIFGIRAFGESDEPGSGGDTTPPILSSPTGTATGSTTAIVGATTDEGNGTLYAFVSTSATPPSAATLKAGTGAAWAGSQAVGSTGAKTLNTTGLTASTGYYAHLLHTDAAGNDSNIVTSAQFTTYAVAAGATVSAAASLIPGSASGTATGTAAGVTLTAAASPIAGAVTGVVNGTLDFQAAGMEFGARTGLGIGTFALEAGVSYRYTIHADGLTLGAPLYTSAAITLDGAGKLPNYVGSVAVPGTVYRVCAIRQSDGEASTPFRIAAS